MFTFLLEGRECLWTLGLFLDSKIHIVLLHVEVDGGSRVTVYRRVEAADRCPLAGPSRTWTAGTRIKQIYQDKELL